MLILKQGIIIRLRFCENILIIILRVAKKDNVCDRTDMYNFNKMNDLVKNDFLI